MRIVQSVAFLLVLLFFSGCLQEENRSIKKPAVITTTYAIYDIAKHIGGREIDVSMLIPPGREVHSFEPTPRDMVRLQKASLILFNGAGLEPWTQKFDFGVRGVDVSKYVVLQKFHEKHAHHHHSMHTDYDPHYWLDVDNMKRAAQLIARKFSELLPKKKALFQKRLHSYEKMLQRLDRAYKNSLKECKKEEIFVNHNAYAYLAKRYGFHVHSLLGLSPDAKPDPKSVEEILKEIKTEDIKVIFHESFENSAVLESIAKDAGIEVQTLQPLANITADEAKKGLGYKEIMLQNLAKIAKALECNGI